MADQGTALPVADRIDTPVTASECPSRNFRRVGVNVEFPQSGDTLAATARISESHPEFRFVGFSFAVDFQDAAGRARLDGHTDETVAICGAIKT